HRIARLHQEIGSRGLRLRPHVWLSEDWFTPDKVPGFAIPFYLAHPRLIKLERKYMFEVEGRTEKECLRIMRHEAGHAIDNAFHLYSRRRYRELFGSVATPYPEWYSPEPNSRDYVLNLPAWYAQSHPSEDFAETFAVWIAPRSRWRKQYCGWPAIRKLEYIDELMRELAGKAPPNRTRKQVERLDQIKITLREHYIKKRQHYAFQWPRDYDRDLLRIFSAETSDGACPSAVSFLRRHRRALCREVAEGTGVHNYAIDQILVHMINRCRELKLRVCLDQEQARQKLLVLLTVHTINGVHSGYHRIAL
ncbi:MAG TPA: putative zinc-binding metallopeptidase, partial [Blastocatellia bacterium]|nr:putative zinc-binding metallopeptidase [Blastocatellia bacterium]